MACQDRLGTNVSQTPERRALCAVWKDRKGILHAIVHNWAAGGHAASADNGTPAPTINVYLILMYISLTPNVYIN
jgi:hypothetical protein